MSSSRIKNQNQISSSEKSSHWILVIIGLLFCLISTPVILAIPEEVKLGNYGILVALIFPLAGLAMLFSAWRMRQNYLFFGPTPLFPSPAIGQAGGQVGGHIDIAQAWQKRELSITLSCIQTYSTGSGKNTTAHKNILWQEQDKPLDRPHGSGSRLEFCFDVPAGTPTQETHNGRGSISWKVSVAGEINRVEFKRSWFVPVKAGTQSSTITIPSAHKEALHSAKLKQAEASIEQQIHTKETTKGLDIISEQGRNPAMSIAMALFGSIFSAVGIFLFYLANQGESKLWFMAPIFFCIGAGILGFGIFLIGRKLECKIMDKQVYTRRSVFGRIIYTRQGKLTSAHQLQLKTTMSSTVNGIKTDYMAIYAKVDINGPNGAVKKEIKLVEGIEGKAAAEAMARKLSEYLLVHNNDLTGELEAL